MDFENKKLQVDILGKKIDTTKAEIEILRQKLIIYLGIVAGSWFYGLDFAKSETLIFNILAIFLFFTFLFIGLGIILIIIKFTIYEKELKNLKKELDHVL
jgi:hypothetical protein